MATLHQIVTGSKFASCRKSNNDKHFVSTHTRIGSARDTISGGAYDFSNDYDRFAGLYIKHVLQQGEAEYFTERQLDEGGPVGVDLDLKFPPNQSRKHTPQTIVDIVRIYITRLLEMFAVTAAAIPIYVFEKADVVHNPEFTKDGIHLIIGAALSRAEQIHLRKLVLQDVASVDIPGLTSEWPHVIDEAVTSGSSPWQLYGSRKPGCQPYRLTQHLTAEVDGGDVTIVCHDAQAFDAVERFHELSIRNTGHRRFELKSGVVVKPKAAKRDKKPPELSMVAITASMGALTVNEDCRDEYELDRQVECMHQTLDAMNDAKCDHQELMDFVMALPEAFYALNGSYHRWVRVGLALHNTSPHMFWMWVKMSQQATGFEYDEVAKMRRLWNGFAVSVDKPMTHRSIRYWVWQHNPAAFRRICNHSIEQMILSKMGRDPNDDDISSALHKMNQDYSVCAGIQAKKWLYFKEHRWHESDSAAHLYNMISTSLYDLYEGLIRDRMAMRENMPDEADDSGVCLEIKRLSATMSMLLSVKKKKDFMSDVSFKLYDPNFLKNTDANPYLISFANTIIDFENDEVRNGRPDDYITMCTNSTYVPWDTVMASDNGRAIVDEINAFFEQLLPVQEERDYVWSHLASCMLGTNLQQAIQFWIGKGCNGKTKLVELMKKVLGDYYGTCPVSLITQKRGAVGGTSSEIAQLRGVRFAVMQEPSKNDRINDGVLKQITGGDELNARQLYSHAITFTPQFKLVMCTNALPNVKVQDDGFWRRVRLVYFRSKFIDRPYEDERFPKEDYPHQFKIDCCIDKKFERWAPVLTSMLVDIARRNQGAVAESPMVLKQSNEYRKDQDVLKSYIDSNIVRDQGERITKTAVWEAFRGWYHQHQGASHDMPKGKELYEALDAHCGKYNKGWHNFSVADE